MYGILLLLSVRQNFACYRDFYGTVGMLVPFHIMSLAIILLDQEYQTPSLQWIWLEIYDCMIYRTVNNTIRFP